MISSTWIVSVGVRVILLLLRSEWLSKLHGININNMFCWSKGSPCLKPLWFLNSWVGLPLTSTENVADSMHPFIRRFTWNKNPNNITCNIRRTTSPNHKLSFDDEFCTIYVCLVCLPLFVQHSILVVVWIGCLNDKYGIFDSAWSKTLSK